MTARALAVWGRPRVSSDATDENTPAHPQTEAELVRLAKQGDSDAFAQLVRRLQQGVYNLAYRFMRDPSLAEDMTQEAFLRAFRLIGNFRGDCAFGTWIYRVTCNVCLTEIGRRKKRGEVHLLPHHDIAAAPAPEITDLPEIIRRCVAQLPRRYAAIITLYYLEEVPYDQITEIMQIPMGTLKTWMHRARKRLGEIVRQESKLDEEP